MEAAWNHVRTQEDFLHSENNMRASRILASSMKKISVGFAKLALGHSDTWIPRTHMAMK